jgi:hypothetical protein
MAFNINEFKSAMNKYGGAARKNLFVVEIANAPVIRGMALRDLTFFCQAVTAPSINVNVTDNYPNGFGLRQSIPTQMVPTPVNAVFMLDSDHQVIRFFHQWMQSVVNFDTTRGGYASVNDQLPYEVGYIRDISTRITIKSYSTDSQDSFYEYILEDAFPTEVSGEALAWSDNDSYATATVNFAYSRVSVSGFKQGTYTQRDTRGSGYLELINRIGSSGQLINQGILPTSIQDAINSFTSFNTKLINFNNSLSQIKSGLNNIGNIF